MPDLFLGFSFVLLIFLWFVIILFPYSAKEDKSQDQFRATRVLCDELDALRDGVFIFPGLVCEFNQRFEAMFWNVKSLSKLINIMTSDGECPKIVGRHNVHLLTGAGDVAFNIS
jgi:hypothetical protein